MRKITESPALIFLVFIPTAMPCVYSKGIERVRYLNKTKFIKSSLPNSRLNKGTLPLLFLGLSFCKPVEKDFLKIFTILGLCFTQLQPPEKATEKTHYEENIRLGSECLFMTRHEMKTLLGAFLDLLQFSCQKNVQTNFNIPCILTTYDQFPLLIPVYPIKILN